MGTPPPPYIPDREQVRGWTGQQWGAYYARTALALGEVGECADILKAILEGKWDNHSEDV